jgi:hypothetical protein
MKLAIIVGILFFLFILFLLYLLIGMLLSFDHPEPIKIIYCWPKMKWEEYKQSMR